MEEKTFEWDNGNWPKCGKHGVSRDEIEQLFLEGKAILSHDKKHSTQHEKRLIAVGRVKERSIFVAFVIRGNKIRPVSARYMHEKEVKNYDEETKNSP